MTYRHAKTELTKKLFHKFANISNTSTKLIFSQPIVSSYLSQSLLNAKCIVRSFVVSIGRSNLLCW